MYGKGMATMAVRADDVVDSGHLLFWNEQSVAAVCKLHTPTGTLGMADISEVSSALGSFEDWSHPWKFIHAVRAHPGLRSAEIELINELWAETTDAKHWMEPDLQTRDVSIRQTLRVAYPWLCTEAIDALMRGASYVWK